MSKGAGQRPKLIRRPSPYLLPILTHHASPQQQSDTDGILTKLDTHWCKQTTQGISKQRVAFMVNHFLPFSLGCPQFFYPCLAVLKVEIRSKHQPQLFFFFTASADQPSMFPFPMKCVKCWFVLITAWQNAASHSLLGLYMIRLTEKAYMERHCLFTSGWL